MMWLRKTPEWFEQSVNPNNCAIRHIDNTELPNYKDKGYLFHGFPKVKQRQDEVFHMLTGDGPVQAVDTASLAPSASVPPSSAMTTANTTLQTSPSQSNGHTYHEESKDRHHQHARHQHRIHHHSNPTLTRHQRSTSATTVASKPPSIVTPSAFHPPPHPVSQPATQIVTTTIANNASNLSLQTTMLAVPQLPLPLAQPSSPSPVPLQLHHSSDHMNGEDVIHISEAKLLASNQLTLEELKNLCRVFRQLDLQQCGTISIDDACCWLESMFPSSLPSASFTSMSRLTLQSIQQQQQPNRGCGECEITRFELISAYVEMRRIRQSSKSMAMLGVGLICGVLGMMLGRWTKL